MTGIAERADSRPRRRARLGSGSWSAIDQALNSATNFAVNIIAIHSLSVRDLGSFAIAFTLYTLGWGVSRAFASEPFIVRWSDRSDDEWRRGSGDSLAAAAAVGVVAGLIGLAAAPFCDPVTKRAMIAIAVFMPGLLLQDAVRLAYFARGRPQVAAINDVLWAVFLAPLIAFFALTGKVSGFELLLSWGAAGSLAGVIGCFQIRVLPSLRGPLRWWRAEHDLGVRYVGEFASQNGLLRVADYGVAGVAGLSALGLFRIAGVLMGPVRIAVTGIALHAIGEGARTKSFEFDRERRRTLLRYAALISAAGLALAGAAFLVPTTLAERVIGVSWPDARVVFAWASLGWIGFAVTTVSMVQLRITANAKASLRAQLLGCVPLAGAIMIGAAVDGAVGAAIGLAIGYAVCGAIWWHHVADNSFEVPPGAPLGPDALTPGESVL